MINFTELEDRLSFENSNFPTAIINDWNIEDTTSWIKENKPEIENALNKSGSVLFRGFPVENAESFDKFARAFDYENFTYQESLSNAVRINLTELVFTANEAPKDVEIFLHHELAQTPISPNKLFFFCKSAAEKGGATPICRSDKLFEALEKNEPELAKRFETLGVKYKTKMLANDDPESGQGRGWQSTLSVETKDEADAKLKELGYSWEWQSDGSIKATTPILPAVKTLNDGSKSFYNQLIAAYLGWEGVKKNPSKAITFGDNSEITTESLDQIVELSKQFTYDMNWQDGDVVLVDNKRVMHGRRSFLGERKREVLVVIAN